MQHEYGLIELLAYHLIANEVISSSEMFRIKMRSNTPTKQPGSMEFIVHIEI